MPTIPGLAVLTDKVPEITSTRGWLRAAVTLLVVFGFALAALLVAESWYPFAALVLQFVIYAVAVWLYGQAVFGRKLRLAYSDAFFSRLLPALGLHLASLAYVLFCSGHFQGAQDITVRIVPVPVAFVLGAYLIITGLLLMGRAFLAAGVETLSLVYNYYPDEDRKLENTTYKLLRHPALAGLARLALAFGLWNGTAFALLLAVVFVHAWHPRWYGTEEAELEERYGDEYRRYRDGTPAIQPHGVRGELVLLETLTRQGSTLTGR